MVIQTIGIKSRLSEDELLQTARARAEKFKLVPGLLQKYYVRTSQPGEYGGVYVWDSKES
jgi:heme-degrading monooxygenase HmoA